MERSSSTPQLFRLSSTAPAPIEYFTDSTNTINIKADVILIVGNERFFCHRLLLSLVSPVFARMFDGEFKEHHEQEVVLEGKSSESILELLKFIYPQFNGQINDENVEDFLKLADEYMIDHLKQPCKEFLLKQLETYKYVVLPTQQKLEQPSLKTKSFHASDSALHSSGNHDDHPVHHGTPRRPNSGARTPSTKPTSSYLKPGDRNGSAATTHPRYLLFLDKTKLPTFYNAQNTRIAFSTNELQVWIRRLRILYQIDRGRNYDEIIDVILSTLQFIPPHLLLPLVQITSETYSTDEIMLNDIARARMFVLEDWASDGDSHRLVKLTESYRTMSPSALIIAREEAALAAKEAENNPDTSVQTTTITLEDFDLSE